MRNTKSSVPPSDIDLTKIEVPPIRVLQPGRPNHIYISADPQFLLLHWDFGADRRKITADYVACGVDCCPLCDRIPRGWRAFAAGYVLDAHLDWCKTWVPCVHFVPASQFVIFRDEYMRTPIIVTPPAQEDCWLSEPNPDVRVARPDESPALPDACHIDSGLAMEMFLGINLTHASSYID